MSDQGNMNSACETSNARRARFFEEPPCRVGPNFIGAIPSSLADLCLIAYLALPTPRTPLRVVRRTGPFGVSPETGRLKRDNILL
jgi:hypothetical protein